MKTPKILTVDDDESIRQSVTEMLELEGFKAVWAKNGQVALDYMMPVMTANGNLVNVMDNVETAGGYMSKPMDYETVVKMVKHFLGNESQSIL